MNACECSSSEIERNPELLKYGYEHLFRSASKAGYWNKACSITLLAIGIQFYEEGNSQWFLALRTWIQSMPNPFS